MAEAVALEQGREAFTRRAWTAAVELLTAADAADPLAAADLELLATAAFLIGRLDTDELWTRAHQAHVEAGDPARAARCAFWLGYGLVQTGEMARASGWFGRAQRVLDDAGVDCVERGYLLLPAGMGAVFGGEAQAALGIFDEAGEIAARWHDTDLIAMTCMARGRARLQLGLIAEGVALLDEAMIAVTADEVTPMVAGDIYCSVIEGCHEIYDIRRAQEWTAALSRWCEAQPDLVPYRGQCLVHRAQLMQLHGAWDDAATESQHAADRLTAPPPHPAAGESFYLLGELHRVRGDGAAAEAAYRNAHQWGREPQPGLALLRLARGQVPTAVAAIRRALDEAREGAARPELLAASVEIALAAGDLSSARADADELVALAHRIDAPLVAAMAAHADGATLLSEGRPRQALAALRRAWASWQGIEAPYDAGRARVLIALALRELGDQDASAMELDAARWVFQQLGAAPALSRARQLSGASGDRDGLTPRETEVLRLVAAGRTNRAIATELVLSEKTVDRHVSNILTKLGVHTRSAATAHAFEHGLV